MNLHLSRMFLKKSRLVRPVGFKRKDIKDLSLYISNYAHYLLISLSFTLKKKSGNVIDLEK